MRSGAATRAQLEALRAHGIPFPSGLSKREASLLIDASRKGPDAEDLALALGAQWRCGRWWCLCPMHQERTASFSISAGDDGRALVHCFGGCGNEDLVAELRARGLWHAGEADPDPEARARAERARRERERRQARKAARDRAQVRRLYFGEAGPIKGTLGGLYLEERGVEIALDRVRFHRRLERWEQRDGKAYLAGHHPALVQLVTDVQDRPVAIQRTYLRDDGTGKADVPEPRKYLGSPMGGAVRLAPVAEELVIGEGVETVASAMQLSGLPGWAALSAAGLAALELPETVRSVLVCADRDANRVGERAGLAAAQRWQGEGRAVRVLLPAEDFADFNDQLVAQRARRSKVA
jgi:putative DNA primase/helicase